jgi:hypothetical protein
MANVAAEPLDSIGADRLTPFRERALSLVPGVTALVAVVGLCSAQGGFFATSWGWAALAFCWLAVMAIVLPATVTLGRLELVALGSLSLLTVWTGLSTFWSVSSPASVLEVQRDLIYPLGLAAVLLVTRPAHIDHVLAGTLAGVVGIAAYALGTRLLQGDVSTTDVAGLRLSNPIGYWNGVGIVCAIGALLALAFVAYGRSLAARALAGATLLVVIPTLYFTFSRGSWAALAVGVVVALAVDARRLRLSLLLLAVGPWPAAALALASREHALTTTGSSIAAARHDGHRVALVLVLLALGCAGTVCAVAVLERRWSPSRQLHRLYAGVLIVAAVAAVALGLAHYGGPSTAARKAYHSFTGAPIQPQRGETFNLNKRLFTFSNNGRIAFWKSAWHEASAHPIRGGGAGTFGAYWLEHRTTNGFVEDAHNLYVEQLAEVGIVGAALLLAALVAPLVAGICTRKQPLIAVTVGAYAAFLVHQIVDWDWELPGVTLVGLFVGAALLVAARSSQAVNVGRWVRWGSVALLLAIGAFSFVGLLGNRYLSQSTVALSAGKYSEAAARAHSAIDWAPWSADAWRALGLAQTGMGDRSQALLSFRKAVTKDPQSSTSWAALYTHSTGATARHARAVLHRLDPRDYP